MTGLSLANGVQYFRGRKAAIDFTARYVRGVQTTRKWHSRWRGYISICESVSKVPSARPTCSFRFPMSDDWPILILRVTKADCFDKTLLTLELCGYLGLSTSIRRKFFSRASKSYAARPAHTDFLCTTRRARRTIAGND